MNVEEALEYLVDLCQAHWHWHWHLKLLENGQIVALCQWGYLRYHERVGVSVSEDVA